MEAPPNICTPAHLARAAEAIAASAPEVMQCKILEREECAKLGMGCYLGVAECSELPPKFIHLTYTPKGARTLAAANSFFGGITAHIAVLVVYSKARYLVCVGWSRKPTLPGTCHCNADHNGWALPMHARPWQCGVCGGHSAE